MDEWMNGWWMDEWMVRLKQDRIKLDFDNRTQRLFFHYTYHTPNKCIQPGAVKLVLWRHLMHLSDVREPISLQPGCLNKTKTTHRQNFNAHMINNCRYTDGNLFSVLAYLSWIIIGWYMLPLWLCSTWPMRSNRPAPLFGTPFTGQPRYCKWVTFRNCLSCEQQKEKSHTVFT